MINKQIQALGNFLNYYQTDKGYWYDSGRELSSNKMLDFLSLFIEKMP